MKTIVLGPPGTGKTETLLREVEKYLKTTDPNRIGYFSFTQKAAKEGRDRAMKKFLIKIWSKLNKKIMDNIKILKNQWFLKIFQYTLIQNN